MATDENNFDWVADEHSTWQELDNAVRRRGDVLRVAMFDLRTLTGKDRLKVRVRADIEQMLANLGIGHLPTELRGNQDAIAVLYKLGSPAAAVIEAVRAGTASERLEQALRHLNTAKSTDIQREYSIKKKELAEQLGVLDGVAQEIRNIIQS
ncbi:hypothetical protein ABZ341_21140 [Streptomyces sp. NPDC006173]|uniref:hypothetical protein n=1 Tax=Streptomyces sp. NPDC006173 TaxID=3155349 RepID=UPI0033F8451A